MMRKAFSPSRDAKDIYEGKTLGTYIWNHITKKKLPRYQWTFLEGRVRIRFAFYSRKLHITGGLYLVPWS